jgi:hypothetical protein
MVKRLNILILVPHLDNSGAPKQLVSLVKFLNLYPNVRVVVFKTHTSDDEFFDELIKLKVAKFIKKEIFSSKNKIIYFMMKKFKLFNHMFKLTSLKREISRANSVHIIGIKPFFRLNELLNLEGKVIVWHNTHKLQYCTTSDGHYLNPMSEQQLMKLKFVTIDKLQEFELREVYGSNIEIVSLKLFEI